MCISICAQCSLFYVRQLCSVSAVSGVRERYMFRVFMRYMALYDATCLRIYKLLRYLLGIDGSGSLDFIGFTGRKYPSERLSSACIR